MSLESFYVPVKIEGIALVYATSRKEAMKMIWDSNVTVCGNKMRRRTIDLDGKIMTRKEWDPAERCSDKH